MYDCVICLLWIYCLHYSCVLFSNSRQKPYLNKGRAKAVPFIYKRKNNWEIRKHPPVESSEISNSEDSIIRLFGFVYKCNGQVFMEVTELKFFYGCYKPSVYKTIPKKGISNLLDREMTVLLLKHIRIWHLQRYTLFLINIFFISNTKLKLAKNQGRTKHVWLWTFAIGKLFAFFIYVIIQKY